MATDLEMDDFLGTTTEELPAETGEKEELPAPPAKEVVSAEATPEPTPELTTEELIKQRDERLSELEKVNNGLLQAKTSAMAKANKYHGELTSAQSRLSALEQELELAKASVVKPTEITGSQPIDKIVVDFDEDGNAFIPADKIPANIELSKKIQSLESELNAAKQYVKSTENKKLTDEALNGFLNEKPGYKEAFPVMQEQFNYLSSLFDQYVQENGVDFPKNKSDAQDLALEISTNPKFQTAFNAKYPAADSEIVMQAYLSGSKHFARKALDKIVGNNSQSSSHKPFPTDKPLPISTVAGANMAKDVDSLEKYAGMDMEDFLRMSPEEERRMNRLLKEKGK